MRTNERFYVSSRSFSFSLAQGNLNYGAREMALRAIGADKGKPWCNDAMANAFRAGFPGIKQERTDTGLGSLRRSLRREARSER